MAIQYSIQKMVSDGTLSTIALGIKYLQRNDIYMRVAGEETPQSGAPSGYTWSFVNNTTLKILPVVPNGVEVVVYRRTDIDAMYNIYSQNAQFDEATIDENNQQLLYIAQEYLEQGIPGAGVDTLEFVRDDGTYTYYRIKRTDGSYSEEFQVPSAGSITKILARESLRRSYAEAGFNLVDGSFEAGGTLVNANDVMLHGATGAVYSYSGGLPKDVAPDSTPTPEWMLVRDVTLRGGLAAPYGVELVGGAAKQSDMTAIDYRVDVLETIQGGEKPTAAHVANKLAAGMVPSISAFGDSCMFGADVTNLANQNPINPPNQLTLALSFLYNLNVPVANRAISGTTLRQLMSGASPYAMTFEQMISAGGPDENTLVIYCNHGINDSAQNLSIDQYRLDLVEFVRLCREKGKVPILATPNPNFQMAGGISEVQSKRLVNFVNVMRSVAEKLGCDLVDQNDYFNNSFNVFTPTTLFPDGIHMSTDAYRQAGFNLAIPLICVNKIGRPGDVAGFSGTTYYDNLTNTRQMQTQPSRTGKILSGNFPASGDEGVNFPVVFDVGQTVVSYIGLQFDAAANCNMYCNGVPAGHHYLQRRFGLQSALDWDAEAKSYGKRMAGLNVFGLLFNRTTPGSGAGMTFGGIALPQVVASSFTPASGAASPYKTDFAATGDAIFTTTSLPADANLRLDDKTGAQVLTVEILSGVMTVKLYNNGVVVQTGTAGSGLPQKEYGVEVVLRENQVVVTLDYTTVTLAVSQPLPMIRVATPLKAYTIKPANAI